MLCLRILVNHANDSLYMEGLRIEIEEPQGAHRVPLVAEALHIAREARFAAADVDDAVGFQEAIKEGREDSRPVLGGSTMTVSTAILCRLAHDSAASVKKVAFGALRRAKERHCLDRKSVV